MKAKDIALSVGDERGEAIFTKRKRFFCDFAAIGGKPAGLRGDGTVRQYSYVSDQFARVVQL